MPWSLLFHTALCVRPNPRRKDQLRARFYLKWIFLMFISSTACYKVWYFSRKLPARKTWQAEFRIWSAQSICALLDILLHNRIWTWGTLRSEAWIWCHGVRCWWTDVYNGPWGTSSKCSWSCDFHASYELIDIPYKYTIYYRNLTSWSSRSKDQFWSLKLQLFFKLWHWETKVTILIF